MKVWYKLDDHQASSLMFEDSNVEDLKQAIKTEWGDQLHCPYPLLKVYPTETLLPVQPDTNFLNPGDPIQTVTSSRRPLIVIAPVQEPSSQQQNGKLRCCHWLFSCCCILVCRWNTELLGSWKRRNRIIRCVYFIEGDE
jgi:hypothetical protein